MGARFTGVALVVLGAWYSWQWYFAMISLGGAVMRVLAGAFIAGGIGKLLGILLFRARARTRIDVRFGRPPHRTEQKESH